MNRGSRCWSPLILSVYTRWRWMDSATPEEAGLAPQLVWTFGEEKFVTSVMGIEPRTIWMLRLFIIDESHTQIDRKSGPKDSKFMYLWGHKYLLSRLCLRLRTRSGTVQVAQTDALCNESLQAETSSWRNWYTRICCSLVPLKTCTSQGTIPFQNIFFFFKGLPPITVRRLTFPLICTYNSQHSSYYYITFRKFGVPSSKKQDVPRIIAHNSSS